MNRLYFRLSLMREASILQSNSTGFYGVTVEAHILELYANAVGTFLTSLKKPYFIDPIFYKFSNPFFDVLSEKRWVDPLLSEYGLDELIDANPEGLDPADMERLPALGQIVESVLRYQRDRVVSLGKRTSALATLIGEPPPAVGPPEFLVVPYVIATDRSAIRTNIRLTKEALRRKRSGEKLYAAIAVSREFLSSPTDVGSIVNEFSKFALDGYLVWICDFKDWEEDSEVLKTFASLVRDLSSRSNGKEVVNLFGGYFSTILAARGLLGASVQGVGIAEFRDPFVTGGGFAKRYYIPISRQFVGIDRADDLRDANPSVFSCACSRCRTGARPGAMSVQDLAQHFVETRTMEFQRASAMRASAIADELNHDRTVLMRVKTPAVAGIISAHGRRLEVWESTLRELVSDGTVS